jgi:hypothetical protein
MAYCRRCMGRRAELVFGVEHVTTAVEHVFAGRVAFHDAPARSPRHQRPPRRRPFGQDAGGAGADGAGLAGARQRRGTYNIRSAARFWIYKDLGEVLDDYALCGGSPTALTTSSPATTRGDAPLPGIAGDGHSRGASSRWTAALAQAVRPRGSGDGRASKHSARTATTALVPTPRHPPPSSPRSRRRCGSRPRWSRR